MELQATNGKPNRGGAPRGNRNRQTHALRGPLTIGSLSPEHAYIRRHAGAFDRTALDAAHARHGVLDLYRQGLVNTATKNEIKGQLAMRWLRLGGDALPLADRLALLKTITDASEARDRALQKLELDTTLKTDALTLYRAALMAPSTPHSDVKSQAGET